MFQAVLARFDVAMSYGPVIGRYEGDQSYLVMHPQFSILLNSAAEIEVSQLLYLLMFIR